MQALLAIPTRFATSKPCPIKLCCSSPFASANDCHYICQSASSTLHAKCVGNWLRQSVGNMNGHVPDESPSGDLDTALSRLQMPSNSALTAKLEQDVIRKQKN